MAVHEQSPMISAEKARALFPDAMIIRNRAKNDGTTVTLVFDSTWDSMGHPSTFYQVGTKVDPHRQF